VSLAPLLAVGTQNLPILLFIGILIVSAIVQQLRGAKKAYDNTVVRQRAERDAADAPNAAVPVQQNAAEARAVLLQEIEAMARSRAAPQQVIVQTPPPAQRQPAVPPPRPPAQRRTPAPQRTVLQQRGGVWRDPSFADHTFATLPATLSTAETSGGLLSTAGGTRAPSSTRRMLAGAFADPAHARSAVILAEVLGTPVGLR
jgi:hypothetical protein